MFTGSAASPGRQAEAKSFKRASAPIASAPSRPTAREVDRTTRQTMHKKATQEAPSTVQPASSASSGQTPSKGDEGSASGASASADEVLVRALKNFQVIPFIQKFHLSPFRPPHVCLTPQPQRSHLSVRNLAISQKPSHFCSQSCRLSSARALLLSAAAPISLSNTPAYSPSLSASFDPSLSTRRRRKIRSRTCLVQRPVSVDPCGRRMETRCHKQERKAIL